jgi:hypothetical protein
LNERLNREIKRGARVVGIFLRLSLLLADRLSEASARLNEEPG